MFLQFSLLLVLLGSFMPKAIAQEVINQESTFFTETSTQSLEELRQSNATFSVNEEPFSQINSVNQLRDVSPDDWAYEALRSLVERYGCIVGYPDHEVALRDRTFRGDRALSRYEFAAGLNACMQQMERLIASSESVMKEDIEKLKRLMQEFETELATLGARVDSLEGRVAFLEDHQFSTTTKLMGSAIFSLSDVFGNSGDRNQAVLQYRANLNLVTSFTGKDTLITSFFAGNTPISTSFNLPGIDVPTDFGTDFTIQTAEGTLSSQFAGNTNNDLKMLALQYIFPIGDRLLMNITSSSTAYQPFVPTLNPLLDDASGGRGTLSEFGQRNPIYALGGGGTGVMMNYQLFDTLKLSGGYLADGLLAGSPEEKQGLFNGGYGALGQLTWQPSKHFSIAAVYLNAYSNPGRFGFNYNGLGIAGTAVANTLAGQDVLFGDRLGISQYPVISNSYGVNLSWQPSQNIALSGWFSTTNARLIGQGDGNILSYALTLGFLDVGKEGNLLGFVFGAQPYLTSFTGGNPQPFKVDVPIHLEGFYRHQINNNISLTPGLIWLVSPNQDNSNGSDVIAVLRTTFVF